MERLRSSGGRLAIRWLEWLRIIPLPGPEMDSPRFLQASGDLSRCFSDEAERLLRGLPDFHSAMLALLCVARQIQRGEFPASQVGFRASVHLDFGEICICTLCCRVLE